MLEDAAVSLLANARAVEILAGILLGLVRVVAAVAAVAVAVVAVIVVVVIVVVEVTSDFAFCLLCVRPPLCWSVRSE